MRRVFRSKWFWLAVCVTAGAAGIVIADGVAFRQGIQLADALAKPDSPRRYSVSILHGLISVEDTEHPYLWFGTGSALTGGVLGLIVWLLGMLFVRVRRWVQGHSRR